MVLVLEAVHIYDHDISRSWLRFQLWACRLHSTQDMPCVHFQTWDGETYNPNPHVDCLPSNAVPAPTAPAHTSLDDDASLMALADDPSEDEPGPGVAGGSGYNQAGKRVKTFRVRETEEGRRQRFVPDAECELVREIVDGFLLEADEDPSQSGEGIDR